MSPRVSVVVTGYNQEAVIEETILSVLNQTMQEGLELYNQEAVIEETILSVLNQTMQEGLELVMVDDASSDQTLGVMIRLGAHRPSVRMISHDRNLGMAEARNTGVEWATSPLLLPLDGDDQLDPQYLEQTVAALDAHPSASICFTDTQAFGSDRGIYRNGPWDLHGIARKNVIPTTALFRREVWEKVGGYQSDEEGFCDWGFWLAAAVQGFDGIHVNEALWRYRRHPESWITNLSREDRLRLNGIIRAKYPALFEEALA
jgi:glycosyltransferase involved in cell wall biosynthesis